MNPKYFKLLNYFFIIAAITLLQFRSLYALEAGQNIPRVSFGAGGLYGIYKVNHYGNNDMSWKTGYGYGGGIVFETMYSETFGLHSGIWFTHSLIKADIADKDTGEEIRYKIKMNTFTMPFYLITSFNSNIITVNLLTGLNFLYIAEAYMKPSPEDDSDTYGNLQKHLGYGQIGAGAGVEFLFKISRFTRLFITITGEYYFENLIRDKDDESIDHIYNATVRAGIMLCTF